MAKNIRKRVRFEEDKIKENETKESSGPVLKVGESVERGRKRGVQRQFCRYSVEWNLNTKYYHIDLFSKRINITISL